MGAQTKPSIVLDRSTWKLVADAEGFVRFTGDTRVAYSDAIPTDKNIGMKVTTGDQVNVPAGSKLWAIAIGFKPYAVPNVK